MKEMPGFLSPGRGLPLLLIPEYSGINKEQRIPDRSKTAHKKPPVQCFLTLLGRQVTANLDSASKSRDITLPTKVKAIVFPVVMYGCESWTIKNAEH